MIGICKFCGQRAELRQITLSCSVGHSHVLTCERCYREEQRPSEELRFPWHKLPVPEHVP